MMVVRKNQSAPNFPAAEATISYSMPHQDPLSSGSSTADSSANASTNTSTSNTPRNSMIGSTDVRIAPQIPTTIALHNRPDLFPAPFSNPPPAPADITPAPIHPTFPLFTRPSLAEEELEQRLAAAELNAFEEFTAAAAQRTDPSGRLVGGQGRRPTIPSTLNQGGEPRSPNDEEREWLENYVPVRTDDGRYKCPVCHKYYLHSKHLKRHLLRHSGKRPYTCGLCGDTFCRSDILKRHYIKCSSRHGKPDDKDHLAATNAHRRAQRAAAGSGTVTPNCVSPIRDTFRGNEASRQRQAPYPQGLSRPVQTQAHPAFTIAPHATDPYHQNVVAQHQHPYHGLQQPPQQHPGQMALPYRNMQIFHPELHNGHQQQHNMAYQNPAAALQSSYDAYPGMTSTTTATTTAPDLEGQAAFDEFQAELESFHSPQQQQQHQQAGANGQVSYGGLPSTTTDTPAALMQQMGVMDGFAFSDFSPEQLEQQRQQLQQQQQQLQEQQQQQEQRQQQQ